MNFDGTGAHLRHQAQGQSVPGANLIDLNDHNSQNATGQRRNWTP